MAAGAPGAWRWKGRRGLRIPLIMRSAVRKALFNILGTVFVGLGLAGIMLPLLPATPFLLLASACYLRGSRRLHAWLMNHPLLGPYVRNLKEHRMMPLPAKVGTIAVLWISIAISIAAVDHPAARIALIVVAACITAYVLRLRTALPE